MATPPPVPFAERFAHLRAKRGPFCLGLDPTPGLLRAYGLADDAAGLRAFCRRVLDAAGDRVAVIKPQVAYFERFGAAGLVVLREAVDAIRAAGSLSVLDGKRGDIGSTNEAYAAAWLGQDSAMGGDAMTLHAYLGFAALAPFVERATATGTGLFVVVLSSNPEGELLQRAQVAPGVSVAEHLSDEITARNRASVGENALGPVGGVVGLTGSVVEAIAARLSQSLLLVPGLGAQGGSFAQLATRFAAARARVIPSASRSVLGCGPDAVALRAAIREHCDEAHAALGAAD